jgi:hypothetical protein
MQVAQNQDHPSLDALIAAIAHSQIVVAELGARDSRLPARFDRVSRLPPGFDDVDVAILTWIAAEGRRIGRSVVWM